MLAIGAKEDTVLWLENEVCATIGTSVTANVFLRHGSGCDDLRGRLFLSSIYSLFHFASPVEKMRVFIVPSMLRLLLNYPTGNFMLQRDLLCL
jgi:hypothetical protein